MAEFEPKFVPDEYLIAIGKVTLQFNVLELGLNGVLVELMGGDMFKSAPYAPFIRLGFEARLDVFKILMDARKDTSDSRIGIAYKGLVGMLKACKNKRNGMMHSSWSEQNGKVVYQSIRAYDEVKVDTTITSVKDLSEAIRNMVAAQLKLTEIVIWLSYEKHNQTPRMGQNVKFSEVLKKALSDK